ncbi:MAG: hypothetical protein L6V93_12405 [Clostridiales bacterium]|nr:MAG: hypothetical protein L6V93_12405 [Clostridiales bacterium]
MMRLDFFNGIKSHIWYREKNRFEPNSYITRETAAAILSRIASLFDVELNADGDNFSDDYQISYWAKIICV